MTLNPVEDSAREGMEAEPEEGAGLPEFSTRLMIQTLVVVAILVIAIYFLFPRLIGLGDAVVGLEDANPLWVLVAIAFAVVSFATYIALFKSVVGGDDLPLRWSEAYMINMAGLAATRFFSAGGAGGIVLTYWALTKAGMARREVGRRMSAFIVLQYAFYPLAIIVFGILLRTGVLEGRASISLTIIPAAIAGLVMIAGLLIVLIPGDLERRIGRLAAGSKYRETLERIAKVPATIADGVRVGVSLLTHPSRGGLAIIGAVGFWAANLGILWASFHAFGIAPPIAVLVQGFFLGMVANLIPFAPAGVGAVDAGMIGVFVLFGLPDGAVFPAILTYRLIAFWLPLPPGVLAFFQLRKRIQVWQDEGLPADRAPAAVKPGVA